MRGKKRFAEWAPAAGILLFHLAFLPGYGVFRDELYYMACGRRPGWGYVDHPPLVGWVAWLVAQVAGESHLALRVVAALAMATTVWLAGRIAQALGGGPFAALLAAIATGLAPVALSLGSYYSMNAFDLLFWALIAWVLVRVLSGGSERLWLAFGAAAGLGLLNKISILYLGFGLVVGLVLARRWDVFRSRLFWAGGLLALAFFLPHLVWQHANGWPTLEFMANARRDKMVPLSAPGFVKEALVQTAPMAWLWVAGVGWLLLARASARVRALGFAFLVVVGVLAIGGGKPYYLAAAYSLAFAAGAVALEGWTRERARALRSILAVLVAGVGLALSPLGRPVLPVETFVRYAAALGQKPGTEERQALGRLPQFYADMQGWRAMAEAVAGVVHALPAEERAKACVFGQNYGEAAAIEYFARDLDLPPAISGHNSYWLWGPGRCTGEVIVVIGDRRERLEERFADVQLGGVSHCADCMPYEDGRSIWVARGLKQPIASLWPRLKGFI
ncbi:MAG TPA: glycosyltransferase family 39 protein [Vicinamibacteria bacterium]|nr:glycosyltransferase family 39 protein [Vicinamibacteria bacterium]